jgi:hypothetical protein
MIHENIGAPDTKRGKMRWSFWRITEARPKRKLDIILQLKEQPWIGRRLMYAGSQSFSELAECDLGKLQFRR